MKGLRYKIVDNRIQWNMPGEMLSGVPMRVWVNYPRRALGIHVWNLICEEYPEVETISMPTTARIDFRYSGDENTWTWSTHRKTVMHHGNRFVFWRGRFSDWVEWLRNGGPDKWSRDVENYSDDDV